MGLGAEEPQERQNGREGKAWTVKNDTGITDSQSIGGQLALPIFK